MKKSAGPLVVDRGFVEDGILPRYVGIISYKTIYLLSQWLTGFELSGIPYLVGKISRSKFFFRVHWLSEYKGHY